MSIEVLLTPDGSTTTIIGATSTAQATTAGILPSDYLFPSDLASSTTPPRAAPANQSALAASGSANATQSVAPPSSGTPNTTTSTAASANTTSSNTLGASSSSTLNSGTTTTSTASSASTAGGIAPNPPNYSGSRSTALETNSGSAYPYPANNSVNPWLMLFAYMLIVFAVIFFILWWMQPRTKSYT